MPTSRSTMSRRSWLIGVPAVAGLLLLGACGSADGGQAGEGDSGEQTSTTIRPVTTTTVPANVEAEQAPVTVEGDALPEMGDGDDAAIGETAPILEGTSMAGTSLTIGGTGRPYLLMFLAHWCPHCQAEVPKLGPWIAAGGMPEGVDAYAVATGTQSDYPNYPPSSWLREEGWPTEVLVDSADFDAANAFGLSAYPFFVLVDAEGKVADRFSGEVDIDDLQDRVDQVAAE